MAGGEATLIRESTAIPTTAARPSPRFLLPRASGHRVLPSLPPLPPHDLVLDGGIQARFDGWADTTDLWRHWVAKLRPLHEPLWRELGIREGILATTYRVRRDSEGVLLQLLPFWSPPTNTFVFPWGEATVTLEDMFALAGLPILGFPVLEHCYSDRLVVADEDALAAVRAALLTDQPEGTAAGWAEQFLCQPEASGGRGEREQRLEHAAFLSLWLARFVLPGLPEPSDDPNYPSSGSDDIVPGKEVLHIAVRMAHGHTAALAPAALASIYRDLTALHRHLIYWRQTDVPSVSAPMHILQLWVWERFPELRPPTAATASSVPDPVDGEGVPLPRAARWLDVVPRALDPGHARAVFRAPKEFQWRPYGSSLWSSRRGHGGATAPLSSFARCLQPCQLVGEDDIEQYNPHRVARQLGFDQDVPGTVTQLNTNIWETAWETYTAGAEDYEFAIPSDEPCVTDEYAQWWKPYSEAYAMAVEERDALESNREFDSLMEETSSKGSGNNEESSSRSNDTSGPKWAVGTMEPTRTILKESNEEKQTVRETNDEQVNGVMKEGMVQNSYDHQLANVQDDTTLRQQPDVLTHAATVQSNDGLLQGPTEEMDTCIVTRDIGSTDKMPIENGGSLNFSEKGNEDILVSTQELEHPMEHSAGASRKKSGSSEAFSNRLLDGNTKMVSHEVCTKTLYYLSRFDRTKEAWDNDANNLPRRAVGTMEMIQKASAIRQAEMAELRKKINTLKEEIRALEAAEKGKSP